MSRNKSTPVPKGNQLSEGLKARLKRCGQYHSSPLQSCKISKQQCLTLRNSEQLERSGSHNITMVSGTVAKDEPLKTSVTMVSDTVAKDGSLKTNVLKQHSTAVIPPMLDRHTKTSQLLETNYESIENVCDNLQEYINPGLSSQYSGQATSCTSEVNRNIKNCKETHSTPCVPKYIRRKCHGTPPVPRNINRESFDTPCVPGNINREGFDTPCVPGNINRECNDIPCVPKNTEKFEEFECSKLSSYNKVEQKQVLNSESLTMVDTPSIKVTTNPSTETSCLSKPYTDTCEQKSDICSIEDLIKEKEKLQEKLKSKEETLRKLNLVKMYRSKNNLDHLALLTDKWCDVSQQALRDLQQLMPEPKPTLTELINHLQIDYSIIKFNSEEEDFIT